VTADRRDPQPWRSTEFTDAARAVNAAAKKKAAAAKRPRKKAAAKKKADDTK
jgi:hypothetical protein